MTAELIPLRKVKDPGAQMRVEMRAETVNVPRRCSMPPTSRP
jgi:hypothetical protein